ncbi:ATP-dependent Clp protease ATP-binding subunit [Halalkalibacterium ligniniphilum]|uniref:ATP-dependent Clp protease ATP-binding subunit n=1 Tax=Halalkalibacterium ligniniphilum TaxID=1134413 RepID=UPI00034D3424|nr:ATP-dependent Clp protease ATP-binding subunit [Halalkalibacterium ligniniphilum]
MKCQNCQIREANVNMSLVINYQNHKLHLCEQCYRQVKQPFGFGGDFSSFDDFFKKFMNQSSFNHTNGMNPYATQVRTKQTTGGNGFLDEHGRNITAEARQGRIDPVIGRDEEIERMIQVLCRRTKNNPVLVGEAGVGKTAIAEGFALRIAQGNVPTKMKNKEVYELELSSLIAGTSYRGQFEEKMKQLVSELEQRKNIILFIDELHMVVGAGSTSDGSMDVGNILKPALARGELQLIGATTLNEYRKIEKDPALERRFQPITVKEPALDKALEILKGIRPIYEKYHQVHYSDEVLQACVQLSNRYIQDRYLPDKAIDLMDEVGSKLALANGNSTKDDLHQRLQAIEREKQEAMKKEEYERAAALRDEEHELRQKLASETSEPTIEVTVEHIQDLIEKQTGIPVKKLQSAEQEKMKDLQNRLASNVIGQKEAVEKVAKAVKRSRAGLKPKDRPISFMFVGPTGVGKTELTKTLAKELFGDKNAMIRLDMSEYMEKHSVSKLIGSPPGYVGHDEGGQLTERVRRNPYSIVLLDEIEKAHPDVQHMFLQILEDGRLTDSQGRVVNFKDTVMIMTSNAGVGTVKKIAVGFDKEPSIPKKAGILESLNQYFKPEFLNRFDAIIEFNHLEKEDLIKIVDLMLNELQERLDEQGIVMDVTLEAKEKLAELGYDPAYGARPLRRVIQEKIEDEVTELIIDQGNIDSVYVTLSNNEINVAMNK